MKIKRFIESTESKSKFEKDMDDLLTKLEFVDSDFEELSRNLYADDNYRQLSSVLYDGRIKEAHLGACFQCQYKTEVYYKDSTFDSFSGVATFYYEIMKVLELYLDDYFVSHLDSMDNEFQFCIYSKELTEYNK